MNEDRLEKVRCVIAENFDDTGAIEPNDIHELMDELTKCRTENKELNALFELQHTRTQKAEKMWQKATGKHNTLPDLGMLVEWLMAEVKRLEKELSLATDLVKYWTDSATKTEANLWYQKRKRKWALHEMYMMRSVADQCDEDCKYHYKNAEKFKKRIGELLAILRKHGIS